jgi:hypothetical protein
MMPTSVQVLVNKRLTRKRQTKKRQGARWLGRDGRRALIACLLLGSLFGFGSEINFGGSSSSTRQGSATRPAGENELTTGSILLVPRFGNECRMRQIDNATWRIWDRGVVDCQTVLNEPKTLQHGWSAARVDVIRDGFRNR